MAREGLNNTCIQGQHKHLRKILLLLLQRFGTENTCTVRQRISLIGELHIYICDHGGSFIDKRKSFHCFIPVLFLCTQNMLLKFNCEMSIKGILFLHSKAVHNPECLKFRRHIKLFCPCVQLIVMVSFVYHLQMCTQLGFKTHTLAKFAIDMYIFLQIYFFYA